MHTSLLMAQQGWSRVLFQLGETDVTVTRLVTSISLLVTFLLLARVVGVILNRVVERKTQGLSRGSLRSSIRLIQYALMLTGLVLALNTLGIQLAALFAAGALFAVALGFAMQNVISNFISGVILLLERTIKPGDIIEVEGQIVEIREMGIRAAIARTLNEEDLIIPSSQLVQSTVRNYTLKDSLLRLRTRVGVTYDSDMEKVREVLERTAADIEWRVKERAPTIYMKEFGASSVDWEVSVWIDNAWDRQRRNSDLHESIWWGLKNAGIVIAFPQVDVHLDPSALSAIGGRRSESREMDS